MVDTGVICRHRIFHQKRGEIIKRENHKLRLLLSASTAPFPSRAAKTIIIGLNGRLSTMTSLSSLWYRNGMIFCSKIRTSSLSLQETENITGNTLSACTNMDSVFVFPFDECIRPLWEDCELPVSTEDQVSEVVWLWSSSSFSISKIQILLYKTQKHFCDPRGKWLSATPQALLFLYRILQGRRCFHQDCLLKKHASNRVQRFPKEPQLLEAIRRFCPLCRSGFKGLNSNFNSMRNTRCWVLPSKLPTGPSHSFCVE